MAKKFILSIDLGGTNLKAALLDSGYRIIDKEVLPTRNFVKKEELIEAIIDSIDSLLRDNHLVKKQVLGVGLGLPGLIDTKKGVVHFFPNIPGWKNVRLAQILEKRLRLPVAIDNDAKLMCLAEYKKGAALGARNALCITLGTGVGGGLIIEGRLYRGVSNAAGEIGHLPLNENGPRCNCGGLACLESYVGNNRIAASARKLFKRDISLEALSVLAKKGNRQAINIWLEVALHLGVAFSAVVNLLNPDCIVIGGGVANAGRVLFDEIRRVITQRAMSVQAKQVKVFKAKLGSDAGLIGAAILVKEGK